MTCHDCQLHIMKFSGRFFAIQIRFYVLAPTRQNAQAVHQEEGNDSVFTGEKYVHFARHVKHDNQIQTQHEEWAILHQQSDQDLKYFTV